MKTHDLYMVDENTVAVNGRGNYFSWYLIYEFDEWELVSMYGKHQGTFKTIGKALRSVQYGGAPEYQ